MFQLQETQINIMRYDSTLTRLNSGVAKNIEVDFGFIQNQQAESKNVLNIQTNY